MAAASALRAELAFSAQSLQCCFGGQAKESATTAHSFTEGLFSPGRQPSVSSPLTRRFFLMACDDSFRLPS
jgi:hypothetical protein